MTLKSLGIKCGVLSAIFFVIALIASHAEAQLAATPWPMFKHNLRHTSQGVYLGPETPQMKWMFSPESQITTSPTIGLDGTLFVGADDGVYAVHPNGMKQWKFNVTGGVGRSQSAIALDGTIYICAYDGYLYAINNDGTLKWRVYIGSYVYDSIPTIGPDGTVYVAGANGDWAVSYNLVAINPTGTEKWVYAIGGGYRCGDNTGSAIGPDGTIYVDYTQGCDVYGSITRTIHAVNPAGTLKWKYSFSQGMGTFGVAIANDNTIYVTTSTSLHAFNPDGTIKWIFQEGSLGSFKSSPSIAADGTIYFHTDYLYAINPDGTQKWRVNLGITNSGRRTSPTIDSGGIIYVQGYSAGGIWQLWAMNPSGTQKWVFDDFEMSRHGVVLNSDGTLYLASNGTLKAIGESLPVPDIKANGSDGPLTIPSGSNLTVTVALDPGVDVGIPADWWVAATSPFGLYWYTLGGWVRSDAPIRTYGGPLFTLSPYEVLNTTGLPVGSYTLYFGVDLLMNGSLDFGQLHVDSVGVTIQ